jgi:ribosome-associated translation inhibitor RaiA
LTLEATKEFLFQHWGRDYKIDVTVEGGSGTIRLGEFVDSEDFYKLIDKLKDLEKRASLRMLRKTRKSLLSTVEDTTRWVQRRSKENITGDRETEFLQVQDLVQ